MKKMWEEMTTQTTVMMVQSYPWGVFTGRTLLKREELGSRGTCQNESETWLVLISTGLLKAEINGENSS